MPDVAHVRDELTKILPKYDLIRDCVEQLVKEAGDKYLPRPNAADTSTENVARYAAYLMRAVFYNVTARTLSGLAGAVFVRDPIVEVPSQLQPVIDDANGNGVNITQEAKEAVKFVLSYGRAGLLIDYPKTDRVATVAQLQSGEVRPTINLYKPDSIINWRTKKRGAKNILSLIVLSETWTKDDDGFKSTQEKQYRVLRLDETDQYIVEIWKEGPAPGSVITAENAVPAVTVEAPKDKFTRHEQFSPTDSTGARLKEIPFTFIGSVNNDPEIDAPPLFDMASLNIAHYRNSADYEEACYIVGQPTPYFTGLTKDWVKDVLKERIPLGSRAAVPLPVGADAGLIQVEANSMPKEAMEHKEAQMVALGAKLVEQQKVQRTATEAGIENASETSTLSSSSKNVSLAFLFALEWCANFVGSDKGGIKFELNTDFGIANLSPEERDKTVKEWQGGAITFTEMRAVLRKAGVATLDDDEAQELIADEIAKSPAFSTNPASETSQEDKARAEALERERIKSKGGKGGGGQ